ncbi:toll/interleukin-1 receptor domain-containing protein [Kibdelosporangium persicum]|uniref:Toll/interleukin-1 receptor domain-containing protein n=1 Tax=Kibdelosporangium persicum TaxID=2698649 RepID=A0ABX2F1X0_9PSEU|nr:toll/interleukin-1 receptor domain-containing protein [Kibdelosporangium persicum]NRN65318.1 Toll/interleukin-1 receptor domain-containing protein [Kibdelosporangium persicum]
MAAVFISYRSTDHAEAERLATELRGHGHDVWLDTWELHVGDSVVRKMNDGLAGAAYLVLCYSTNSSASPWQDREWMSALHRQVSGKGVTLLPVRLTGGESPAILADIKHVDLTAGWSEGVQALLAAMK